MIEEFLRYMRLELNRSRLTAEAYGRDLHEFAAFVGTDDLDPSLPDTKMIRAWIASLADAGNAPVSLRRKTQSLRAFLRWAMKKRNSHRQPGGRGDARQSAETPPRLR